MASLKAQPALHRVSHFNKCCPMSAQSKNFLATCREASQGSMCWTLSLPSRGDHHFVLSLRARDWDPVCGRTSFSVFARRALEIASCAEDHALRTIRRKRARKC
ncbi:hypothetical protein CLAIMM_13733 [Cladophialophora immunda]|nr:hypothetical protein CLAIMM_13733 [Cladophialophora immunda]